MRSIGNPIVDEIRAGLAELYDERELRLWLDSPQPLLEGATPNVLIRRGRADEVLRVVRQIGDGVHP